MIYRMYCTYWNHTGNKVRWNHHGGTMQKGEFFVTGEVFLLDIGLLMGAKTGSSLQVGVYRMFRLVVFKIPALHYLLTMVAMLIFSGQMGDAIYGECDI
ncbi:MAG: hypothetical protein GQ554_01115 [Deltaproteobacteria bacterium]|nr:hypothetical protein [Deltaproteobacteria bacterium]